MITYLLPILAVFIGATFVFIFKPSQHKNLKLLLAFSGAFLLGITIFEFLPKIYETNTKEIGIFIVLGILLQICLEFFSKGAEHGHVHISSKTPHFPWVLFLSLSIHSIFEGAPLNEHHNILLGVVIHKVPIAIILTTFFINSTIPKKQIIIFLIAFAFMTPIGTGLVTNLPEIAKYSKQISGIAVGIFLHISTTIIFESSENHKFNLVKILIITFGLLGAYFI